jgi:hypothetical protein
MGQISWEINQSCSNHLRVQIIPQLYNPEEITADPQHCFSWYSIDFNTSSTHLTSCSQLSNSSLSASSMSSLLRLVSGSGGFSSLQSVNSTVSTKNTVPVFSMEPGTYFVANPDLKMWSGHRSGSRLLFFRYGTHFDLTKLLQENTLLLVSKGSLLLSQESRTHTQKIKKVRNLKHCRYLLFLLPVLKTK